jgi:hypothetical protein
VLKETTILTWRAFLGEQVLVIPVLLGVGRADLAAHGFEPSGVSAIQAEEVPDGRGGDVDGFLRRRIRATQPKPYPAHNDATALLDALGATVGTTWLLDEDEARLVESFVAGLQRPVDREPRPRVAAPPTTVVSSPRTRRSASPSTWRRSLDSARFRTGLSLPALCVTCPLPLPGRRYGAGRPGPGAGRGS